MDAEELELVRSSFRHLAASALPAQLPAELLGSGWAELLAHDRPSAVGLLFEEQGRGRAASPALDLVVLDALGLPVDATTAVVLPPMGRGQGASAHRRDGVVMLDGLVLAGHERAQSFVAVTGDDVVRIGAGAVELAPVAGLDPSLGLRRVRSELPASAVTLEPAAPWPVVVRSARRALAHELVGLGQAILDAAVAYVLARHQFGRPIGAFQTVKHRLADVHVALTAARDTAVTAWEEDDDWTAMATKAQAGRAFLLAATHGQQVHGGISFTAEHDLHHFIHRGYVIDSLFGASQDLVVEMGRLLLEGLPVPRVPRL